MKNIKQFNSDINKGIGQLESIENLDIQEQQVKDDLETAIISTLLEKLYNLKMELFKKMPVVNYECVKGVTAHQAMKTINDASHVAPLNRKDDFPTHKGH